MKQSGIDWIGEIPDDWKISKAKTILRNKSIKNHPAAEVLSLYRDLGIVPKNSRNDNHNVTSDDTASYKFVQKGELVLNKMKTWQGSLAVSDYEGIVSPAYYVCEFTNQEIDKKYIHYLLRNKMYAQEFERLSTGLRVGQWDLNIDDFLNTPIVYPPKKATQKRIAEYLDSKCAQIDSIIEESKKSIEEYKAWKQSVIFEAVTGKNLNCKKKDSGIEWIGKIPEGWSTIKFKYLHSGSNVGESIDKELCNDNENDTVFYTAGLNPIHTIYKQFPVWKYTKQNDLLLARNGTPYVYNPLTNAVYSDHIIRVTIKEDYSKKYVQYAIQQSIFNIVVDTVSITTWSASLWNNQFIPLPPRNIQEKIVETIENKLNKINSLILEKESLIADLTEYKKSLIFEVVTGKRGI